MVEVFFRKYRSLPKKAEVAWLKLAKELPFQGDGEAIRVQAGACIAARAVRMRTACRQSWGCYLVEIFLLYPRLEN